MFTTLVYHIINREINDKIAISEEAFEEQLDYLHSEGYHTLSLSQAIDDIDGKQESPPCSLLLTFDDGYVDNIYAALPRLQCYNMKATLFVISAYVGQTNRWNPRACYDVNHATWDELCQWLEHGCDIGGHTHQHLCMTRLNGQEMYDAVYVNKRILEEHLHIKLRGFSYPYGAYNQLAQEVVSRHYEVAFALGTGSRDARANRYTLHRLTIDPGWTIEQFANQLAKLSSPAS